MKFEVRNRWSGEVQFTAEIKCDENAETSIKLGLAVKWAVKVKANLVRANLDGANLYGANLDGANLYGASLDGANLDGANLVRANLDGANLVRANLDGANLYGASLDGANLDGASLDGANLVGANLVGANLDGANLVRANLDGASGNNRFIRSIFTGVYSVTYTAEVMQIGCQRHAISDWWAFDDRRILEMDGKRAADFWRVWKPLLQQIIAAAPAEPTGYVATSPAEPATA